jgi:hypothetical protein
VLTEEEELGAAIGAQLRAEVADIDVRLDLLSSIRRRRGRRSAAIRCLVAGTVAAVIAGAGIAAAVARGTSLPGPAVAQPHGLNEHRADAQVIQLDGYFVKVPTAFRAQKVGAGYLITSPTGGHVTIFIETGLLITQGHGGLTVVPHQVVVPQRVQVGSMTGQWSGDTTAGELRLQLPGMSSSDYLVAKDMGMPKATVLRFAAALSVTKMRAVHVSCSPPHCGYRKRPADGCACRRPGLTRLRGGSRP